MAKTKTRRKPIHKRVEGINYIIYANGDVRQDMRGGKRPGSGRKALSPGDKEFHSLKLNSTSSSILAALSANFSRHSDRKITKLDIVTLIVHKANHDPAAWMKQVFKVAQSVAASEKSMRIRQSDYEKINALNEQLLKNRGVQLTATKLFNLLIEVVGYEVLSDRK
jgi:hypothetical protein